MEPSPRGGIVGRTNARRRQGAATAYRIEARQ